MADMQSVSLPQPPSKASLDEIWKYLTSLNLWLNQNFGAGVQQTFLSQNQVNNITGNENLGKIHYNNDTNQFQCTQLVSGSLVVKTIQTA